MAICFKNIWYFDDNLPQNIRPATNTLGIWASFHLPFTENKCIFIFTNIMSVFDVSGEFLPKQGIMIIRKEYVYYYFQPYTGHLFLLCCSGYCFSFFGYNNWSSTCHSRT